MIYIPDEIKTRILEAARIADVVPDLFPAHGKQLYCKCPFCGSHDLKKKHGLMVNPVKNIAKCFACGKGLNAASYLTEVEKKSFPEALKILADKCGILIPEKEEKVNDKPIHNKLSFCDVQLHLSGLVYDDIRAEVADDDGKTIHHVSPFCQGTRTQYGQITEGQGDDLLIKYFDLAGKPVLYKPEKSDKLRELVRVRWQNPEAHCDKYGNSMKYQSPAGSGSHIYIPEKVRQMYKAARPINRLFIQEGEKKAEKSCKHGIMSIGVMGIQNLGAKNRLPEEIQLIIHRCEVKEVVFILDSDYNQLSGRLKIGEAVDMRPKQFFYAVRNYKDYMRTLVNLGISVEIFFGHVKPNTQKEKGIDDLLAGSLKTDEAKVLADIDFAIHSKDGAGQFVNVYKITQETDQKIADHWFLNDAEKFAQFHKTELNKLPEFKINGLLRRFNEKGEIELAQPLLPEEQYWEEETNNRTGQKILNFHYVRIMRFLQNRGFFNFKMQSKELVLVQIKDKIIQKVDHVHIKHFVKDFTREIKREDILNMIFKGGPQYLGPEKLSNLDVAVPIIERADRDYQNMFFQNKIWEVTAHGTKEQTYNQMANNVWADNIISADVKAMPPLLTVRQLDKQTEEYPECDPGDFIISLSDEAKQCHFLKFLINTSTFHWRKLNNPEGKKEPATYEEDQQTTRHVINKMTCIGYLLHDYRNYSETKAVIGMDGKLSEVGSSNGRSGKSLIGKALEYVIPQVYIDAKRSKLTEDAFLWQEVTEKTRNVFLDDTRANVDFEHFFPVITGRMLVNTKGAPAYTLSERDTPKLYITTNHSILGDGASFIDRQAFMVFSDFYNDTHKPIHDFGVNFFSEWDQTQWNLFYNLMANCLQLYFQSQRDKWDGNEQGIVKPPMESVEKRKLRQLMGENFLIWADAYFAPGTDGEANNSKLNTRCVRKDIQEDFLEKNPQERKYMTPSNFSKRIRGYCKYNGYRLNPGKQNEDGYTCTTFFQSFPGGTFIGSADKAGGLEYMTVANEEHSEIF
jgi:DNA primase